jgi:hypothetical protein
MLCLTTIEIGMSDYNLNIFLAITYVSKQIVERTLHPIGVREIGILCEKACSVPTTAAAGTEANKTPAAVANQGVKLECTTRPRPYAD